LTRAEPVLLGTVVSRATLHNQDEIERRTSARATGVVIEGRCIQGVRVLTSQGAAVKFVMPARAGLRKPAHEGSRQAAVPGVNLFCPPGPRRIQYFGRGAPDTRVGREDRGPARGQELVPIRRIYTT
jgi:hypothetical protein